MTLHLQRIGRDYWLNGLKIICVYFAATRFRVHGKFAEVAMSRRRFFHSKKIGLVKRGETILWVDKANTLTLHPAFQTLLRKLKVTNCIHIRISEEHK